MVSGKLTSSGSGPLDRKLMRDLWRMKGQAVAIAVVIALGVLMLVMMDGLVNSLGETKRAYYERHRLADVFVSLKRAPQHVLKDIVAIPGVTSVEGRVNGGALIDLPDVAVPIRAQALSLPDYRPPRLNDIYLAGGRLLNPAHEDEVLLLEAFAKVHALAPGAQLSATMNGARRNFRVVGLVQSPEFLFSAPPGEMMPDDARFAVIWMSEKALAAAYDLDGAFNAALLSLARDADLPAVLDAVDRIVDPYGGFGAYGIADHVSERFIHEELEGLAVASSVVPPVFLAVAAFLLNIVISRTIQAEREQIGLLKAFGYSSLEIGVHYFKFILVIAAGGAILGCFLGVLAGRSIVDVYLIFYKFPFLVFQVDPRAFIIGFTVSVVTASAGGLFVLRRVFVLTPAVAMRPPAPADFSRAVQFGKVLKAILDQPSRMVVRRLLRQPGRTVAAVVSIAAGMSLSVAMIGVMNGFDTAMEQNFTIVDRSDVTVSLVEPLSDKTIYELQRLEGVVAVEGFRSVPVVFRNGLYSRRGAISGMVAAPTLNRAVDEEMSQIPIRGDGVILSKPLADVLHIQAGDTVLAEVREGRRPVLELPVVGIAQTLFGAPAYMEITALNRQLKEPNRVNGAYLRIDSLHADALYRTIKDMPSVAGVSLKNEARKAFQRVLDTGAGTVRFIMTAMAAVITFGIIYNSARVALAERARDLASLRVLGFTRGETAFVLFGELGAITVMALPLGCWLGFHLAQEIAKGFSTDLYQVPAMVSAENYGTAVVVMLVSALVSAAMVKRDVDRSDLVSALKNRE